MSRSASLPGSASASSCLLLSFFFFNDTATTEIYTLSLHDALPISTSRADPLLVFLGQRFVFLGPPHDVLFWPVADFRLHQPALGVPTRFSSEVAVFAGVGHEVGIPPLATLPVLAKRYLPRPRGEPNTRKGRTPYTQRECVCKDPRPQVRRVVGHLRVR